MGYSQNGSTTANIALERHPRGLYVLFATEMWERFGFYTMLALFTLYLRDEDEGFGWTAEQATSLYANYLMFVYASPLVGGFLANWKLGFRRSVMIGGVFFMAGYLLLSVPSLPVVYAALACLVIGNGFFKPNISAMVGNLYPPGSHLKDRAYNIFYMGINVGALLAPISAELIRGTFGFHPAFAVAAGGMVISVAILWCFQHTVEKSDRLTPATPPADEAAQSAAVTEDTPPPDSRPAHPIEAIPDWQRIGVLLVIFLIVIVFWMVFHQNGSTMTYWANKNTDWTATENVVTSVKARVAFWDDDPQPWKMSGVVAHAINPFWVVTLTFPLIWFWRWLDGKGLEPSTPTKMAIGMFLTSVAFLVLFAAAKVGEDNATDYDGLRHAFKVSPAWLVLTYGVLTLAELMLSPMGLALVAKVSPPRHLGLMMGGWFVATAIGNKLTQIGVYWDYWMHSTFWLVLSGLAFAIAVFLLLLLRPLKKAMPGV
jgi:POT family proton-dependent oligopeptide transporter